MKNEETTYQDKLKVSHMYEEMWHKFYDVKFPGNKEILVITDNDIQRQGVDKIITTSNDTRVFVEEKTLLDVHDEICFEWLSNSVSGESGWIEKPLICNYLAYAFAPIETVYLFEWRVLQAMWKKYGDIWKSSNGCKQIVSTTVGKYYTYQTYATCVPIFIVEQCYMEIMITGITESHKTTLISEDELMKKMISINEIKNETAEHKQKRAAERVREIKKYGK